MGFILDLNQAFIRHSNRENKAYMEAYLKNKFVMFGLKSARRRQLFKGILKQNKTEVSKNCREIVYQLYELPQREFHYSAIELVDRFLKKSYLTEDISLIEHLVIKHSHWDTVDFIAKHILGNYLLLHQNKTKEVIANFSGSNNMWLNRSAILFQLGRKDKTDQQILFRECKRHSKSNEFFIRKAIGWALRDYARTNPEAVKQFVKNNKLASLSTREALKHFN